jgi:predicted DsbA family dithiol-disulfide isomerase
VGVAATIEGPAAKGRGPGGTPIASTLPLLQLWVDPGCPWAWQTATWLRELRDRGLFTIDWHLFSLEVNAMPDGDYWDQTREFPTAHAALMLAQREGGQDPFERLYVSLADRLHDPKHPMTPELLTDAADDAGLHDLVDRARSDPGLSHAVIAEHQAARARDVFGVPTLSLDGSKVLYGPILPIAPSGDEALEWWNHIRWLLERPDFFELKRWPRDIRPGAAAPGDREKM